MTRAEKAKLIASINAANASKPSNTSAAPKVPNTKTFEVDGEKIAYKTDLPSHYGNDSAIVQVNRDLARLAKRLK